VSRESSRFQDRHAGLAATEISSPRHLDRILIVRLSAMGDVIHTLPAAGLLRNAFPNAHIGWLIEERWAELLCAPGFPRRGTPSSQRPLVDEIHTVNLKGWRKSLGSIATIQRIATVWNDVRAARYDVAIDLQGAIRSAVLARFSSRRVYGAAQPRESPASLWYTRQAVPTGRHVVQQNVSVARALIESHNAAHALNISASELCCDLPRDPRAEEQVARQLNALGIHDFAILNPGAGWGAKRWPAERYGEVARQLANLGMRSILNYGPGEEDLVRAVEITSGGTAWRMQSSITELVALTRRARLFIGGDTGPLHLAAALRVPVVGIYGPTDPARNGPYRTRGIVVRRAESVTTHARRAAPDEGLLGISSNQVVAAAHALLTGGGQ
jgi:heptosyltransferase I